MRLLMTVFVLTQSVVGSGALDDAETVGSLDVSEVSGIWKMCYVSGLAGVSEPDGGYLVLMPDFRYYEIVEGCCREGHEPPIVGRVGTHTVGGRTVVLRRVDHDGREAEERLRYVEAADVVVFDDLKGLPVKRPVLYGGETINYGYAKVFWQQGW
jgi:hypothetical protein